MRHGFYEFTENGRLACYCGQTHPTEWSLIVHMTKALEGERTLSQSIDYLHEHWRDGVTCPCCNQFAKIYKRKLNAGIAYSMCRIAAKFGVDEPFRTKGLGLTHDPGMARHWGLLARGDHSTWSLTLKGYQWVMRGTTVPKYILVYDNKFLGFDGDERVDVVQALGDKFDYNELMRE